MFKPFSAFVLSAAVLFPSVSSGSQECIATGIGFEQSFAESVCEVAREYGLPAEEVDSFGGGAVDIFISEAAGRRLHSVLNRERLISAIQSLTEWAKRNYTGFNQVEVTVVSGDVPIAQGVTTGTDDVRVTVLNRPSQPVVRTRPAKEVNT